MLAGRYPNNSPIPTDTLKEIIIELAVGTASIPMIFPIMPVRTQPSAIPIRPPMELVTAASMTNCLKIVPFLAPRDFRTPIYLVRSVTDTSMIFMTPTPATRRDIPAMPPKSADIMAIMEFKESNISLMAVTV